MAALLAGCGKQEPPPPQAVAKPPAPPAPQLLFRVQSVGLAALAGDTNAVKLRTIGTNTATLDLWNYVTARLSSAATNLFATNSPTREAAAEIIRPMIEDLASYPALLELHALPDKSVEWTLAAQLPGERTKIWTTNVQRLLPDFARYQSLIKASPVGAVFRLAVERDWILVGIGPGKFPSFEAALASTQKSGQPAPASTNWLEWLADFPKLAASFPVFTDLQFPALQFSVSGRGELVRTRGTLEFTSARNWPRDPWVIPTNIITEPLIGFSASRGLLGELAKYEWFKKLKIEPAYDQFYTWGQSVVPYQAFAAFPVKEGTNSLNRLATNFVALTTNLANAGMGETAWSDDKLEFYWRGFPILVPFIKSGPSAATTYLTAGFFPPGAKTNPPPPELLDQVTGRTNLVYYGWEITENRLSQWYQLSGFMPILAQARQTETNITAQTWLRTIGTELGNTGTEIRISGPRQLELVRSSHIGLTGFELVLLAHWLDNPSFPGYMSPFEAAVRQPRRSRRNIPLPPPPPG